MIFTPEQVKNLEEFQHAGVMHPFTCGNRGDGKHFDNGVDLGALIPTTRGWICQCCDYTQDWAHDFMLDGSAVRNSPLHAAIKARPEERAPVCWVVAVEEYGQMVVYGPQYTARRSAEQDAELPRKRGQKAEVWACYRPLPMNSGPLTKEK